MSFTNRHKLSTTLLTLLIFALPVLTSLAQDDEASSTPAGMAMLVLFLGIAGIVGVFVIRWSQSTPDDDE